MNEETTVADLFENSVKSISARGLPKLNVSSQYTCRFCERLQVDGAKLCIDERARTHAAAHRIAFECLMESNPLLVCPFCETAVVSDQGILCKTNEAMYNDLDLVAHLEAEHPSSLASADVVAEFVHLSYLLTSFTEVASNGTVKLPRQKASTLPVSIISCVKCDWRSDSEGLLKSSRELVVRIVNHLLSHIDTMRQACAGGSGDPETETQFVLRAEKAALTELFLSADRAQSSAPVVATTIPYADKIAPVYFQQLIELFGVLYPLMRRALHGLSGNPFLVPEQSAFEKEMSMRCRRKSLVQSSLYPGMHTSPTMRGMDDFVDEFIAESEQQKKKTSRARGAMCGRVECGHTVLDFADSESVVLHVLAHVRHDEVRLSRALEGLNPIVCRCGIQVYSPIGLLYHIWNEHIFDTDPFPTIGHHDLVLEKCSHIVFPYAQSCIRARQKCKHKTVITEWMARMGLQYTTGAEEHWAMVDVEVDENWLKLWNRFAADPDPRGLSEAELSFLFCLLPFGNPDLQFVDPAKTTYRDLDPKEQMKRVRRMFNRIMNNMESDKSKWLARKRLERDRFDKHRRRRFPAPVLMPSPSFQMRTNAAIVHPSRKRAIISRPKSSKKQRALSPEAGPSSSSLNEIDLCDDVVASGEASASQGPGPKSKNNFELPYDEVVEGDSWERTEQCDEDGYCSIEEENAPTSSGDQTRDQCDSREYVTGEEPPDDMPSCADAESSSRSSLPSIVVQSVQLASSSTSSNSATPTPPCEPRVRCILCKDTTFLLNHEKEQRIHAAAHAILLVSLTAPTFMHAGPGISCPGCPGAQLQFYSTEDFEMTQTVLHMVKLHGDACLSVYTEYLDGKFPQDMFLTDDESCEQLSRISVKCKREECGAAQEVCTLDVSHPLRPSLTATLPVLKHVLWHVRSDRALDLDKPERDLLTRCLMLKMGNLQEANMAVHVLKTTEKYPVDQQREYIKFLLCKLRNVVCSVFGLEAAWVLQAVFPVYNLRTVIPLVFSDCGCVLCENKLGAVTAFQWNPLVAAHHALTHQVAAGFTRATHSFDQLGDDLFGDMECPLCSVVRGSSINTVLHLLSTHTMVVNAGLLYPLLSSMDCVDLFCSALRSCFGSNSWQLLHAFSFPEHNPRALPSRTATQQPARKKKVVEVACLSSQRKTNTDCWGIEASSSQKPMSRPSSSTSSQGAPDDGLFVVVKEEAVDDEYLFCSGSKVVHPDKEQPNLAQLLENIKRS